ncbi:hypothetical protein [Paenibacillus thermotolerans]|uniref:hypothetical protein n=1 Tax=Paenibacillus thermotolerans TaxID=3027807 RepID=UPI0023681480|nr:MULTISPECIES: hypothetical protein [unclassified Paenibacillus]
MQRPKTEILDVFFDESGKRKDKPNLMGALSMPRQLYMSTPFQLLSQKLRDGELKLHWTEYTGYEKLKTDISETIAILATYHHLIKFFVINYDYSVISNKNGFSRYITEEMIYTKFPERIIYGLLRRYGRNVFIEANLKIEDSSEYQTFKLHERLKDQLNVQSLYRGERFIVNDSLLIPKGQEIGVELVDILLGMIRTIIVNQNNDSKGISSKNSLVIELLKNPSFFSLLKNIRCFEWEDAQDLTEVSFGDYLQLFLANHYTQFYQ